MIRKANTVTTVDCSPPSRRDDDASVEGSNSIDRLTKRFRLMTAIVVLSLSFAGGIVYGMRRDLSPADAGSLALPASSPISALGGLAIPAGLDTFAFGEDLKLNGNFGELVAFTTDRRLEEIFSDQIAIWKKNGLETQQLVNSDQAVALAVDRNSSRRWTISAWRVPAERRDAISGGREFQGVLGSLSAPKNAVLTGEVPDVPVVPGGQPGVLMSSRDPGGRSYLNVYTNPGGVDWNARFYIERLGRDGWIVAEQAIPDRRGGLLRLTRGHQEILFLFAERDAAGNEESGTSVSVIKRNTESEIGTERG